VVSLLAPREKIIASLLLFALLVSGSISLGITYRNHSDIVPVVSGSYQEGLVGQPSFLNPILASSNIDQTIDRLLYAGLYSYDNTGAIVPDLAESLPTISDDGKTYTVKLRSGLLWHNDNPLTADDVVFTITAIQNADYGSPLRNQWLSTMVTKQDDRTVVFTTQDVAAPFLHNLTIPIASRVEWSALDPKLMIFSPKNLAAVGSGPYRLKEVERSGDGRIKSLLLTRNTTYHREGPYLQTITLRFYNSGDELVKALHGKLVTGFGFNPFANSYNLDDETNTLTIRHIPLPQYQAVFFNITKRPFRELSVRQALSLATDRDALVQRVFPGQASPIAGPMLPEQVSGLAAVPVVDITAAETLLDKAGWVKSKTTGVRSKNKLTLSFTIITNDSPVNQATAETLRGQWQTIGAVVTVKSLASKEEFDAAINSRSFDALVFAETLGADGDPFLYWHSSQIKAPGLNITGYDNQAADKLINQGRGELNSEKRQEAYRSFDTLLRTDAPAVFLAQSQYTYAVDSGIRGVDMSALPDATQRLTNSYLWFTKTGRRLRW
jgi:peptide/nickel transport system substrate-binding protein